MADHVLTDREIDGLVGEGTTFRQVARAVEAAVIARVADYREVLADKDAINRKVREYERAAWDAGAWWGKSNVGSFVPVTCHPDWSTAADTERNRRYPLPEEKPDGVTLSDGQVWFDRDGLWVCRTDGYVDSLPPCRTPEDYEAVAAYLRRMAP